MTEATERVAERVVTVVSSAAALAAGHPERKPRRLLCAGILALLIAWTLPPLLTRLGDFPPVHWAEMGIAAPAHKLAAEGVYGNDLYAGHYRAEERNYEYMPAYPILVALSFKAFGLGVFQARLVSVLCALVSILLIFELGRRFGDWRLGLLAAFLLTSLRLGYLPGSSGIVFVDLAREVRYDILVPVFVLASSICFLRGAERKSVPSLAMSGLLAGLATLAHLYGTFILPVFVLVLLWERGWRTFREPGLWAIAAGWMVGVLPWVVYVLRDVDAYLGQMAQHAVRFEIFSPAFYWSNLLREPWRYGFWSGGSLEMVFLRPRVALWLVLVLVPVSTVVLWRRARTTRAASDRFLLLALPVTELGLALLLTLKRHNYTVLVLPFIVLQLAFLLHVLWTRSGRRATLVRWLIAAALTGVAIEREFAVAGMLQTARQATPYYDLAGEIAAEIPRDASLLMTPRLWLGLKRLDYNDQISLNRIFQFPEGRSMSEIIDGLDPDYVVIESVFLEPDRHDGGVVHLNETAQRKYSALATHLDDACSLESTHPSHDYGEIQVWRCSRSPVDL